MDRAIESEEEEEEEKMETRGNNANANANATATANVLLLVVAALLSIMVFAEAHGHRGGSHGRHRHDGAQRHREHLARGIARMMADSSRPPSPFPSPSLPAVTSHKVSKSGSRVFHVTDYGADPTGKADSTDAIMKAITDAFDVPSDRQLIHEVTDLGGAEIHLDGGAYLISKPLTLPHKGGANLKIHSGSLRASNDFPKGRYLIEVWSHGSKKKFNYEYVTLRDLVVDSNLRGGGIAVVDSLRTTIDNCYVVHFETNGIYSRAGHETMIRGSYLGQRITGGGDPREKAFSGVGIHLDGNDNAVTDTVVFSAGTGILATGQANIFTGVHCYNKATWFGGVGIHLRLAGNTVTRIVGSYMDYNSIVAEDPVQLLVSGSFFLGDGNVVLRSVRGRMKDVAVVDNLFTGTGKGVPSVALDERAGPFADVNAVVVERNGVNGMALRSTSGKMYVRGEGPVWTADFSPVLLFPNRIDHVQYSLQPESGFPKHALRSVAGNKVVVETDAPAKATVYVSVYQRGGTT